MNIESFRLSKFGFSSNEGSIFYWRSPTKIGSLEGKIWFNVHSLWSMHNEIHGKKSQTRFWFRIFSILKYYFFSETTVLIVSGEISTESVTHFEAFWSEESFILFFTSASCWSKVSEGVKYFDYSPNPNSNISMIQSFFSVKVPLKKYTLLKEVWLNSFFWNFFRQQKW